MKLKEFSHYILTRFNTQFVNGAFLYDNPVKAEKWMSKRMELFRETKKSVLSQEGDFEWVISLDDRTPGKYIEEIIDGENIILSFEDVRDTFKEGWNIKTPWVITTRLDNDDQLQPGFVKVVQSRFEPKIKVIDVRFEELDPYLRMVYEGERRWAGSMFISLIEPSDRIVTAFCRPHGMVAAGYPVEGTWDGGWGRKALIPYEIIEEPLAYMVCHDNNIANRIRGQYLRTI